MSEAVEECRGHLGIAEYTSPFTEAEVGGDDDAGLLLKPREQVEQQRSARGAERQVAEFVEDDEVKLQEPVGELDCVVHGLFLLKRIDQVDGGEEPDLLSVVLDGLDAEGGGDVGLAGARPADENYVVGARHELASMQLADQGLGNLAGGEVEAGQILVGREPGGLDLVGDCVFRMIAGSDFRG